MDPTSGCLNTVTRTVWAGDQIAYEIRAGWDNPNNDAYNGAHYRRVGYLYVGALDRPIALWKATRVVHPHSNARGAYVMGTCGTVLCNDSIDFRAGRMSVFGIDTVSLPNGPLSWYGSIIAGQIDASGLLFRRSRYMNPNVGTFTQPDPLGIAGGLDVYGYVGGDPVNHADPSGLDPTYHLGGLTVSVSRCDDNFRWTCGTGGPPGTGPVVGPVGFPGASGAPGSGVSSGGGSGGHDETRSPTCSAAWAIAGLSLAGDVALGISIWTGAGLVLEGGRLLGMAARNGTFGAALLEAGSEGLGWSTKAVARSQGLQGRALRYAGLVPLGLGLGTYSGGAVETNTLSFMQGSRISTLDFVPVAGTLRALGRAWACSSR